MEKGIKRTICVLIAITIISNILLLFPNSAETVNAAYTYNVDAAMSYAASHYKDNVMCATFVSRCVQAGGLNVPTNDGTGPCFRAISKATGVNAVDLKLNSNGYATKDLDGNILSKGDPVYYWCNTHSISPHIIICDGYDSKGIAVFYGTNSSYHGYYRLNRNTSYQHTTSCDMGARVLHISQQNTPPVSVDVKPGDRLIDDGDYLICAADTSNGIMFIDSWGDSSYTAPNGNRIQIYGPAVKMPSACDTWTVTYKDGYYRIALKTQPTKSIDILEQRQTSGTILHLWDSHSGHSQQWVIAPNGSGYRFVSRWSGMSIDITGANLSCGTQLQQWTENSSSAQRWIFIPRDGNETATLSVKNAAITDVIKNVTVSDVTPWGYTVTCELGDFAISSVAFPSWTTLNDQDDLFADWENTAKGTISGNKVTYRVNTSDHWNQSGCEYLTHIYAKDYFGNTIGASQDQYSCLRVNVPSTYQEPATDTPTPTPTATPTVTPTVVKKTTKPTSTKKTTKPAAKKTAVSTVTKAPVKKATVTKAPVTKAPAKKTVVSLKLNTYSANIVCGKTITLRATLTGSRSGITWKTSDPDIATVDANGNVTARKAGPVTIYASAAGKAVRCRIQVLYKDVTASNKFWYAPTNYLTNKEVVKGYNNQTRFKPANKCTRAQMVTFIWRLEGCPEPSTTTCKFKDVKRSDYFYEACIWGNEQGIVEGYKNGTFKPKVTCARRHAVTFLWRLAGEPDPESSKNPFSDVKKKDYFYTATLWAAEKGILEGYSDGTFRPNGDCLRRQMVTFLYKYDKYVNGKG